MESIGEGHENFSLPPSWRNDRKLDPSTDESQIYCCLQNFSIYTFRRFWEFCSKWELTWRIFSLHRWPFGQRAMLLGNWERIWKAGTITKSEEECWSGVYWRGCQTRCLPRLNKVEGVCFEVSYRYPGLCLDSKLTIYIFVKKLEEKLLFQAEELGKLWFSFCWYRGDL